MNRGNRQNGIWRSLRNRAASIVQLKIHFFALIAVAIMVTLTIRETSDLRKVESPRDHIPGGIFGIIIPQGSGSSSSSSGGNGARSREAIRMALPPLAPTITPPVAPPPPVVFPEPAGAGVVNDVDQAPARPVGNPTATDIVKSRDTQLLHGTATLRDRLLQKKNLDAGKQVDKTRKMEKKKPVSTREKLLQRKAEAAKSVKLKVSPKTDRIVTPGKSTFQKTQDAQKKVSGKEKLLQKKVKQNSKNGWTGKSADKKSDAGIKKTLPKSKLQDNRAKLLERKTKELMNGGTRNEGRVIGKTMI